MFGYVFKRIKVVAAASVSIFIVSCSPTGDSFFRDGIGSGLAISEQETIDKHKLQKNYFNYLCKESGIFRTASVSGVSADCIYAISDSNLWNTIVKQGMNDIDRRCDAYLEWLDDKKRSKSPLQNQLTSVRTTTQNIIDFTSSGATKAISIVGQAFQLLNDSIENYHSRLLFEVDQSTITAVVFRERQKFREALITEETVIGNKPDAEYVLRNYLQICLPFAIESVINGNATLVALGVDDPSTRSIHATPALVKSIPQGGGEDVVKPTTPTEDEKFLTQSVNLSAVEKEMQSSGFLRKRVQKNLCVEPTDGIFGSQTRVAIHTAKLGLRAAFGVGDDKNQPPFDLTAVTDRLEDDRQVNFFANESACSNVKLGQKNTFEKYAYNTGDLISKNVHKPLLKCYKFLAKDDYNLAGTLADQSKFTSDTRTLILEVKRLMKNNAFLTDQISSTDSNAISPSFSGAILNYCEAE